ncbi:hypothetical protein ACVWXO_005047 [Bradyrhizobium sp. LM2.7]
MGRTARPHHGYDRDQFLSRSGRSRPLPPTLATELKTFWTRFFATAFNPYRPELHYMRGPGPAWRAKHGIDAPLRLKPRDL